MPPGPPIQQRIRAVLAVLGAATLLGTIHVAPASAQDIPRGMPQVVSDVLGPQDPSFWNPAVTGTRVLT